MKKETKKLEEPALKPVEPEVGRLYRFTGENGFIGSIQSLDPLIVFKHEIKNGCQSESEIVVDLNDYVLIPMSKQEYYQELA